MIPGLQGLLEQPAQLELLALQVLQAILAPQDLPELLVSLGLPEPLALRVLQVPPVLLAHLHLVIFCLM